MRQARIYNDIGDTYWRKGQMDSARIYNNKAYALSEQMNDNMKFMILNNFGNIYLALKQPELAINYYRKALPYGYEINWTSLICESSLGMSRIFEEENQQDSALLYANASLAAAQRARYSKYILESSNRLAELYTKTHRPDSTVKYLNLSIATRDSLFNRDKLNKVKVIELQEMARQQEIAEAKAALEEERHENIQYAIIMISILCLVVLLLMLSKSYLVSDNLIRYLCILVLLLFFEFINLLLHPHLILATGHSPIAMLLIMVGIAAILIPMHHRIEHWIIEKLVQKNKEVRLATANRIIVTGSQCQ